jgi:TonB family protein
MIPSDVLAFELEDDVADSRFAGFHNIADEEIEEPDDVESGDDQPQGGQGQRADGAEGEMGKPTSKKPKGVYKMRGPADSIPQLARNFDATLMAREAGVLGLIQQEQGHVFASVHGGAFAIGQDDEDIWGGLKGNEYGEAQGVIGGLGLVGTGHGGGGTGEGTIGYGNTGLIGKGGSGGKGTGYGRGSGTGFGHKVKRGPEVKLKPPTSVGSALDKSIIRRVVRAHINEVRSCYNQGLVRNPNLRGRLAVQFTIGGTGVVTNAVVGETSLSDPQVGRCVAKAVKRWRFPKPQGGGIVLVTYPFSMDPAT